MSAEEVAVNAIADYMDKTAKTPTHIALTDKELRGLWSVFVYAPLTGVRAYAYGCEVKLVEDDYSGPRVWEDWAIKTHEKPIHRIAQMNKARRDCLNCGAPWKPTTCEYCGS